MGSPKSIGSVATGSIPDSTLFVKKCVEKNFLKSSQNVLSKTIFLKIMNVQKSQRFQTIKFPILIKQLCLFVGCSNAILFQT